jgi:hypothetical protein
MQKEEAVVLKKYTGTVIDVWKDCFLALLEDTVTKTTSQIFISKDQVFSGSHDLILPGVPFTWEVGYSGNNQKRSPLSLIRFSPSQ